MRLAMVAAALVLLQAACSSSPGGRSGASVGRQLADLRQTYEAGAITREEYEQERRRILGEK